MGYASQQSLLLLLQLCIRPSPAQYRDKQEFYPLLLQVVIHNKKGKYYIDKERYTVWRDRGYLFWMELLISG